MNIILLTDGRFVPDVFKEDVECLQELDANVAPRVLVQDVEEEEPFLNIESEALSGKSNEYFEYNITDPKFLHDSIAYD